MSKADVVVIGGGAAGLFCAIEAGKRGRSVIVIEHNDRVGRKIEISGGGRCNFTNVHTTVDNFISANPSFAKSALARFTPEDFIALVRAHRIAYHEKKLGQLFCDDSSREIVNMLLSECDAANVTIETECRVERIQKDSAFVIESSHGRFECESLVIATGGLSIPTLGATEFGYRVARQFGLAIVPTKPALVPFTFSDRQLRELKELSGVAVDALVRCNGAEFRENVLLTHRGMSGPAILQVSSYWSAGDEIAIDLLPDADATDILRDRHDSHIELANILSLRLPRRFAHAWCNLFARSKPVRQYSARELEAIANHLHDWKLVPDGTEGFRKAEVTAGGVDTRELSSKTMESRRVPSLYFIGEVVDVTGQLGGYNFQWAWSSGFAAGQFV